MKTFLLKACLFFAAFAILLLGLFVLQRIRDASFIRQAVKLRSDTEIICFGDSHIECNVSPDVIPRLESFGSAGEPLWFSLIKMRMVLNEAHPNLRIVVVGLPTHVSDFLFSDRTIYDSLQTVYLGLIPVETYGSSKTGLVQQCCISLARTIQRFFKQKALSFHGGFSPIVRSWFGHTQRDLFSPILDAQFKHARRDIPDYTEKCRACLREMASLARNNRVQLVFLRTPCPPEYRNRIDEQYIHQYQSFVDLVRVDGAVFLDHWETPFDLSEFYDSNHLNKSGAEKFSRILKEELLAIEQSANPR